MWSILSLVLLAPCLVSAREPDRVDNSDYVSLLQLQKTKDPVSIISQHIQNLAGHVAHHDLHRDVKLVQVHSNVGGTDACPETEMNELLNGAVKSAYVDEVIGALSECVDLGEAMRAVTGPVKCSTLVQYNKAFNSADTKHGEAVAAQGEAQEEVTVKEGKVADAEKALQDQRDLNTKKQEEYGQVEADSNACIKTHTAGRTTEESELERLGDIKADDDAHHDRVIDDLNDLETEIRRLDASGDDGTLKAHVEHEDVNGLMLALIATMKDDENSRYAVSSAANSGAIDASQARWNEHDGHVRVCGDALTQNGIDWGEWNGLHTERMNTLGDEKTAAEGELFAARGSYATAEANTAVKLVERDSALADRDQLAKALANLEHITTSCEESE